MSQSAFHLTFGRPESPEEAWFRLPERDHPLYENDPVIEHLTHVKEWFIETYLHILKGKWSHLENRLAPLTVEDMAFMRQISFVPDKPLFTANWKHLPKKLSPWNEIYLTGDNQFRWWQVCPLIPQPLLPPGVKFVSIETNNHFSLEHVTRRFDDDSEFEVGWVKIKEIDKLNKGLI